MSEKLLEQDFKTATLAPIELASSEQEIANRVASLAGRLALRDSLTIDDNYPISSLAEAIKSAAQGDDQAVQLIKANVSTDVIERTIKAGFVSPKMHADIGSDGSISQYGQSYLTIQANSLVQSQNHLIMKKRTESEARNALRIEELARRHILDDYSLVVFSRAENLANCGFFLETMSCAIQLTTKDGQGIATQSAFVAGKDQQGKLHDQSAVEAIYNHLAGVDIRDLSPAEIIDRPLIIPNWVIPNGVIDLVKLYDQFSGNKFFGLDQPQQDYLDYQEQCLKRQADYSAITNKIVRELISQAEQFQNPKEACLRLNQLSEYYTLQKAVIDRSIDPRVFGRVAADHLIQARVAIDQGLLFEANREFKFALKTAKSSSCPTVVTLGTKQADELSSDSADQDEYGSLTFICSNGHFNYRRPHKLIKKCQHKGCEAIVKC